MSHGIKGGDVRTGYPQRNHDLRYRRRRLCALAGPQLYPDREQYSGHPSAIGVVLAIIAMVGTFRGKKAGKILSIVAAVLSVLAIVITLAMQSAASKAIDEAINGSGTSQSKSSDAKKSGDDSSNDGSANNDPTNNDSTDTTKASGEQDQEGDLRTSMSRSSPRRNRATTMKTSLR